MSNGNQLYYEDFAKYLSRASGQVKLRCPLCDDRRTNKLDRSLSIDAKTLQYNCHYCGASGVLKKRDEEHIRNFGNRFYRQEKIEPYRPPVKIEMEKEKYSEQFLKYFSGRCISKETLIKAKVTEETNYFPQLQAKKGCIAFNYFEDGKIINIKYRTREKLFCLVPKAELIPYNIDSIAKTEYAEGEEKSCIFVEGEMDCLTYLECGYKHVVSCPNGANQNTEYLDRFVDDYFDGLDIIYISVDNDSKGLSFREELLRRFGESRCRIVDYPKPCKDINEVLMQKGKDAVDECVKNYTEIKPVGVESIYDFETQLDYLFYNGLQRGVTLGIPQLDDLVSFSVGYLCTITGLPTHGKTYMLNNIMIRLNLLHDWKWAIFSPEFYPLSLHAAQLMETMCGQKFQKDYYTDNQYAEMKKYMNSNFHFIDPDYSTDINYVMDRAQYMIKKYGVKGLVLDPFNSITDNTKSSNEKSDEYISDFLQKIRAFARKNKICVFVVAHPRKMNKLENGLYPVPDLYDIKGASEWYDKTDIGLSVWRNEIEDYIEVYVTKIKFRNWGEKGSTGFKFNQINGRFLPIGSIDELKASGQNISMLNVNWDNSDYLQKKLTSEGINEIYNSSVRDGFNQDDNTVPPDDFPL